jgi:ribosomal-protein-alanine N-acetyltransferase
MKKQPQIPERIEGTRIALRRVVASDARAIARHCRDKAISRHTFVPYPYGLEHAQQFIRLTQRGLRDRSTFVFAIEHRESKELVGMIGFHNVNYQHSRAELGYWLARSMWGQGLMTEAVPMMVRFAFDRLQVRRVYGFVFPENPASSRVLEKCGFTFEGTLRKSVRHHGRYRDNLVYSILHEEFDRRKPSA